MNLNGHSGTIAGTLSGTLLTVFANIHSEDLVKTIVLATLGAVVSFGVSVGLKWVWKFVVGKYANNGVLRKRRR